MKSYVHITDNIRVEVKKKDPTWKDRFKKLFRVRLIIFSIKPDKSYAIIIKNGEIKMLGVESANKTIKKSEAMGNN
jgi:hypothetical protein